MGNLAMVAAASAVLLSVYLCLALIWGVGALSHSCTLESLHVVTTTYAKTFLEISWPLQCSVV